MFPWIPSARGPVSGGSSGPTTLMQLSVNGTGTQTTNGLQYGYYTSSLTPSSFSTSGMAYSGGLWSGTESGATPIAGIGLLREGIDSGHNGVVRWTSNFTGGVTVTMNMTRTDPNSDGVYFIYFLNSTLTAQIGPITTDGTLNSITFGQSLTAGDTLDFVCYSSGSAVFSRIAADVIITNP